MAALYVHEHVCFQTLVSKEGNTKRRDCKPCWTEYVKGLQATLDCLDAGHRQAGPCQAVGYVG